MLKANLTWIGSASLNDEYGKTFCIAKQFMKY